MHKIKHFCTAVSAAVLISLVPVQASYAYSNDIILKQGIQSSNITELQRDLKNLGFFYANPTGYFGNITKSAVIKFQKRYNLKVDGIAGEQTITQINRLFKRNPSTSISRGGASRSEASINKKIQLLPWFGKVENIFTIGNVATVTDVDTGLKFKAKRTFGYNHADVETLTTKDTEILKKVSGGYWNWTRRAVIVEVDGYRIAASITAMPHAGRDDKPANIKVSSRSGGYGWGANLDSVKGNGMDGQFDIHFYGSKTHGTNSVDKNNQAMIQKAYKSGL